MTSMPAGNRWLRPVLVSLWLLLTVGLAAEVLCRVWTWHTFTTALEAAPDLRRRLRSTQQSMHALPVARFLEPVARRPLPVFAAEGRTAAPKAWRTPTDYAPQDVRRGPRQVKRQPGTVRVLFCGGSSTFDGYPDAFLRLAEARFGKGKVEVINAGISMADAPANLLLLQRFIPLWTPDWVVAYDGFNDVLRAHIESRLADVGTEEALRNPSAVIGGIQASRGLVTLLATWRAMQQPFPARGADQQIVGAYEALAPLIAKHNGKLVVTTHPVPDYAALTEVERRFFEVELLVAWPALRDVELLARAMTATHLGIRTWARSQPDVKLLDWAAVSPRRAADFLDNCHQTEAADKAHAAALLDLLAADLAAQLQARQAEQ
jgi:hypothetical protein